MEMSFGASPFELTGLIRRNTVVMPVKSKQQSSSGRLVKIIQTQKKTMDFEVPRDINSEIPDSFRRIRCIRQNMKTENIIETNGENSSNLKELPLAQPLLEIAFSKLSGNQIQALEPRHLSDSCKQSSLFLREPIKMALVDFLLYLLSSDDPVVGLKKMKDNVERRLSVILSGIEEEVNSVVAVQNSNTLAKLEKHVDQITLALKNVQMDIAKLHEKYELLKELCDRSSVESLVKSALEIYDADKTGLHDFAVESAGGKIVLEKTSATYMPRMSGVFRLFFSPTKSPGIVIQRKLGFGPGECWAFEGGNGVITVKLSQPANVSAVSYEHLSAKLNPDGTISSAPKNFQIWGYNNLEESTGRLLGEYKYSDLGPPLQFFKTQTSVLPTLAKYIEFRILSNYGSKYTCLYRFRVHGSKGDLVRRDY
ncbi:unnamed protein product [Enterobius vermicularis]|uniref:SUN domain-containing protein n=1 Tax=Enterobius vermicularis TaxID=51028 RepID=A0A0N4V9S4_ENTVE|nr:unnamed protein product [Enterobius vermicularis]